MWLYDDATEARTLAGLIEMALVRFPIQPHELIEAVDLQTDARVERTCLVENLVSIFGTHRGRYDAISDLFMLAAKGYASPPASPRGILLLSDIQEDDEDATVVALPLPPNCSMSMSTET
jgi:hypothetical protein